MIYHNHHIVPRHMGGGDDDSNIVRLTVEEHAEAHRLLYEEHGCWQDKIAWQTLNGQITNAEAAQQARRLANTGDNNPMRRCPGAKEKSSASHKGRPLSKEHKARIRETSIFLTDSNPGKNPSEATRQKMRESHRGVPHNPVSEETKMKISKTLMMHDVSDETKKKISISKSGKIYITNGLNNQTIAPDTPIPNGWRKGRVRSHAKHPIEIIKETI